MVNHLRANLCLLLVTLLVCSVAYPLVLWGIGQAAFPNKAEGSLIERDHMPVGSHLIAQPFVGDEYFQPRPSAAAYNAAASGASNWAASNYLLRDRVARRVGTLARYHGTSPTGNTVQQDVEAWLKTRPDLVATWAEQHPGVAQAWVNADDKHKAAVTTWQARHPEAVAEWKKANPDAGEPKPTDLAVPFFKSNAQAFHKEWPKLIDDATWSVPAVFFDLWHQENPGVLLDLVPADLVTASASGLDPHITLAGARYQLDRVAGRWAERTRHPPEQVRNEIDALLQAKAEAPLGGLVGVPLINVLEVNLALRDRYELR